MSNRETRPLPGTPKAANESIASRPRKRTPWGDIPRNRITIGQFWNLWAAFGHAEQRGLRPNWPLDIHYERGELAQPYLYWASTLQRFLKLIRDWVRSQGEQTAYLWATENNPGIGRDGTHTHLLIHVPPRLEKRFRQLIRKWGRQANLVMKQPTAVLNPKPLGGGNPTLTAAAGKLRYLCKDLEPEGMKLMSAFRRPDGRPELDDRNRPSTGGVLGKKAGVSRNIDRAARAKYRPPLTSPPASCHRTDGSLRSRPPTTTLISPPRHSENTRRFTLAAHRPATPVNTRGKHLGADHLAASDNTERNSDGADPPAEFLEAFTRARGRPSAERARGLLSRIARGREAVQTVGGGRQA